MTTANVILGRHLVRLNIVGGNTEPVIPGPFKKGAAYVKREVLERSVIVSDLDRTEAAPQ